MKQAYWGGVTSLAQVSDLLAHVLRVVAWAASSAPRWAVGRYEVLNQELFALYMAVNSGEKDLIKANADRLIQAAQRGQIDEQDFAIRWNITQFVKKFEYGCTMSPDEAKAAFLERDAALAKREKLNVELRACMRALIAQALPCPPEFGNTDDGWLDDLSDGRFSSGSVYEGGGTYWHKCQMAAAFAKETGVPIWDPQAPFLSGDVAKLHAVPKDAFKLRTITVEPIARTWHQQAVRRTLLRSVHRGVLRNTIMDQTLKDRDPTASGLSVWGRGLKRSEPRQKVLCARGALTGDYATLDLSNASDTISLEDVYDVFPAWVTPLLEKVRTPNVEVNGAIHPLHMYAGMGNATTFVVETLYFWSLFTAVANIACGNWNLALGRRKADPRCGTVTVYGDDIVCRNKNTRSPTANPWAWNYVLARTPIQVNVAKSGVSRGGGFREACGEVSYYGTSLSQTYHLYGAATTREGAARYCDLASRLLDDVHPELQLLGFAMCTWDGAPKAPYVHVLYSEDSAVLAYREPGTRSYWAAELARLVEPRRMKTRWNRDHQVPEIQLERVGALTVRTTVPAVAGTGEGASWVDYQLALLGQRTRAEEGPTRPRSEMGRTLSCTVPHRTKVRRSWVPGWVAPSPF